MLIYIQAAFTENHQNSAIAQIILLTDMSYLLHHISTCYLMMNKHLSCVFLSLSLSAAHSFFTECLAARLRFQK